MRQKVPFLRRTLLDIDSVLQSLPDHADAVAREIRRTTENLIEALRQRQEALLDDLTKICGHKAAVLHKQKSRINSELEILESNCGTVKEILQNGSNSEIAGVNALVRERLEFLQNLKLDTEPEENSGFGYDSGCVKLNDEILKTGAVFSTNSSASLKVLGDGLYEASVEKFASFFLAKSDKCDLHPGDLDLRIETPDSVLLEYDVTRSRDFFEVVYKPKVPGEHEISITVRGQHIPDSPVCINVKEGHVNFSKSHVKWVTFGDRGSAPGCFTSPCDLAVRNNGQILVADTLNHRVQILDPRGEFISNFGQQGENFGELFHPSGIAVSPHGHVIVSDHGNNRVQVFTSCGVFLRSFGSKGDSEGYMHHPTGIAVDEEGHILVADQENHRIQIFDENGRFIRQFGCYGKGACQLDRPMYIAISPDGDIFVTDSGNHRVVIFNGDGRLKAKFGKIYHPTGISVDAAGFVLVSDRSARLQLFDAELQFVTRLEPQTVAEKLECPVGIDYSPEGRIVIADKGCCNVRMLLASN